VTDDPDLLAAAGTAAVEMMTLDGRVADRLVLFDSQPGVHFGSLSFLAVRDKIADALGFHLARLKAGAEAEILRRIDIATDGERKARELLTAGLGRSEELRSELKQRVRELEALSAEKDRLIRAQAERIAAQSELLSRRAGKP
jgi:hypothetical protein